MKTKNQHCLNSCQLQSESRIYKDKIDTINRKWPLRLLAWYTYLNKRWRGCASLMDQGLLSYLIWKYVKVLNMLLCWHLLYIKNELICTCAIFVESRGGKLYLFFLMLFQKQCCKKKKKKKELLVLESNIIRALEPWYIFWYSSIAPRRVNNNISVWGYPRGNQNSQIEERQTPQWTKENG